MATTYTYNGHTYLLSITGTWQAAQADAQSQGGNLVTINNQAEQDFLVNTFGTQVLWIGYTDQQSEGTFVWISGENANYTNWVSGTIGQGGQPDNHNDEDYAVFNPPNPPGAPQNPTGTWGDVSVTLNTIAGIIELPYLNHSPTGSVTIDDTTPELGQTLTVSNTLADEDGLGAISYQWYAGDAAISGATGSTYTLTQSEVGKTISVKASYTDQKLFSETQSSDATSAVVSVNYSVTGDVSINGTVKQGQILTVINTLADANGLGTVSYQWLLAGAAISGANSDSYTLTQSEVGKAISVKASYTDKAGYAESKTSASVMVDNVNDSPTGSVTLSGITTQGQTLTVSNSLADADGLGDIGYTWLAAKGTDPAVIVGTGSSYTLTQAEVGKTISVTASYTDGQGTAESKTSSSTGVVANVNDAPTGTLTIAGTPTQGQTLTVNNQLVDLDGLVGVTFSYQWRADNVVISGATASSYTLTQNDVGKTLAVTASYTDQQNTAESKTSEVTAKVANINDAPVGSVSISGIAKQGVTLIASNDLTDLDGLGPIQYRWLADGTIITTASNQPTYTLTQAEVGKTISVEASYIDGQGKLETQTSAATAKVENVNDALVGSVSIEGIVSQGQTLTAANTLTDADGLGDISYTWQAAGVKVGTGSSYTLTQAEVGKTITVTASYTDGQGTFETKTSSPTGVVANTNDPLTGSVLIVGTPSQGQTLTINNQLVDADGFGALSYEWYASGSIIDGATADSYTLTQSEVGKTISVKISYTDLQNTPESKTSPATAKVVNVNDAPAGSVTITGTTIKQGSILTASNNLTDPDGMGTVSYQWLADGSSIVGATQANYTLTQAEVGKMITVSASYTDTLGKAESIISLPTEKVGNINDAPGGVVSISGKLIQGETLTAANTLTDVDGLGTISYQWQADGLPIAGATLSTYLLTQSEVGKKISVVANYVDGQKTPESVVSSVTDSVVNINDSPAGSVTITGTAKQGVTLTASNNLTDADGLGAISYQWFADGNPVAVGDSYPLSVNEVDKKISVTASYTDGFGKLESVSSSSTAKVTPPTTTGVTIIPNTTVNTGEDGTSAQFSIRLNTAPAVNKDVVISFASSDSTEGTVDKSIMTFTSVNYATPQLLTVRGVDDYLDDGDLPYQVMMKLTTLDVSYKSINPGSLNLINKDDGKDTPLDLYGDQGGDKNDTLVGGNGNDILHGLNLADDLSGGLGNDTLYGGYGADDLFGNDGNDVLYGEQEKDYLDGGAGNDSLNGGDDVDTLIGGIGNDTLDGGLGSDSMSGGEGNDTYYLSYDALDQISDNGALTDRDTVIMPYQLSTYTLPDSIENGMITPGNTPSSLSGNDSNNLLTANDANNTVEGGAGNDTILGGGGNDYLESGDGDDSVDAGAGNDLIVGGNGIGNDIYIGGLGSDTIKYASAVTTITVTLALGTASGNEIGNDKLNSIENLIGGQAGDSLIGSNDNNQIDGYTGNDSINGGLGKDTMIGGLGNDTYFVDNVNDVVTETSTLATEIDTVNSSVSYTLKANIENLNLTGKGAINGTGNTLKNVIVGNGFANILTGGAGSDTLTGGLGVDRFKLAADSDSGATSVTRDVITDFRHDQKDRIDLSAIDANSKTSGNNAFSSLTVGNAFSGAFAKQGSLYFDKVNHILYGNDDADSAADFSIQLTGVDTLVLGDFIL